MSFFKSDQVQENLQDIFNTYQEIASMTNQLPRMNKEDRLEHIDKCKVLIDKQKTFYFRLKLAAKEDAEASDMMMRIDALSQAFGYTSLLDCMDAMVETLGKAENQQLDLT
jgi:hypothetical protein|tara:strand:+ start:300 stop:632 length:333 start_codon:yes stop_codon:yes gene_type:complete